jgi:hypothetical protein
MRKVVENEKLMYDGLITSTDPREFLGALKDYLEFITAEGTVALDGLRGELNKRASTIKSIQNDKLAFESKLSELVNKITKVYDNCNEEERINLTEDLRDIYPVINKTTNTLSLQRYQLLCDDLENIFDKIVALGYEKPLKKYFTKGKRDITVLYIRKEIEDVFNKESEFNNADHMTLGYCWDEIVRYSNLINNDAKKVFNDKDKVLSYIKRIHNYIQTKADTTATRIFTLVDNQIYHYKKGHIQTKVRKNGADYLYVLAFKQIISYFPSNKRVISLDDFRKLLPTNQKRQIESYRKQVGISANSFKELLKEFKVENKHPTNLDVIITATDTEITFNNIL